MNYTTNYKLPQWVETDRIQMEDFNEAMATIDAGLAAAWADENKPYVAGSVSIAANLATGSAVVTFDFEPGFVILYISSVGFARQSTTTKICTNYTEIDSITYGLTFRLSGTNLFLSSRGSDVDSAVTLNYMAFR